MSLLVFFILLFCGLGAFFLFIHLTLGKLIRPNKPEDDKLTIYECGEPTIGSAFIQFDLRYYVVALLFVIFDVEVAFFFPWAVVFGTTNTLARPGVEASHARQVEVATGMTLPEKLTKELMPATIPPVNGEKVPNVIEPETAWNWAQVALIDILVFFGVLMVGFAYLWKRGDINWIRSTVSEEPPPQEPALQPRAPTPPAQEKVLVGSGQ